MSGKPRISRKASVYVLIAAMAVNLLTAAAAWPADNPPEAEMERVRPSVPGEFIVKFRTGFTIQSARKLASADRGTVVRKLLNPQTFLVKFDVAEDRNDVVRRLKKRRDVVYIEPNGYVSASYTPNDPMYRSRYQWNFGRLNVSRAWNYSRGNGAVVAVVDTGVARRLTDLKRTRFVPGYDFVNRDRYPTDDNGHGSHVAGTIAQSTNNSRGVAGIAYRAKIMPVKVLDSGGFGTFGGVADGVRWAADHGAHVINLSLGSSSNSRAMREAVDYARYRKNAVVVAAAGNSGSAGLSYPAAYTSVIAVSATDFNNALAWYSSWGTGLALSAPGGDTSADQNSDGRPDGILQQTIYENSPGRQAYRYFQGTSMAAPHVSAVAALIHAQGRRGAGRITQILKYSARDLGAPGYDTRFGWGLVSAYGAVRYRPMTAPHFTRPAGPTTVNAGSRMAIRWNRRGKRNLRYQVAYSRNAGAVGRTTANFENAGVESPFRAYGNGAWVATNATAGGGSFAARSADIGDSQTSELSLSTRFARPGTVSFDYRVSSESDYDFFDVYIDGRRVMRRSGNVSWRGVSFPVAAGQHRIRWVYSKDYSVSEGLDAGFVDNITATNVSKAVWHNLDGLTASGASSRTWTVPNRPGAGYRFRIRAYNGVKYGVWMLSRGRVTVR